MFCLLKESNIEPGQHEIVRREANGIALTIWAKGVLPIHSRLDRYIAVREAECWQSIPLNYHFHGDLCDQCKQVGNAGPIKLSQAIARGISDVLVLDFEYESKNRVLN